jgi:hypothetical protein
MVMSSLRDVVDAKRGCERSSPAGFDSRLADKFAGGLTRQRDDVRRRHFEGD